MKILEEFNITSKYPHIINKFFALIFKVQKTLILFKKKTKWLSDSAQWCLDTKRKTKVSHSKGPNFPFTDPY